MKRRFVLTAALVFLLASFSLRAFATYSNDEQSYSGNNRSSGSGVGTQAAAGMLSYMVNRAIQKKGQAAEEALMAPPSVVTVVEFPVDASVVSSGDAEITVQKGENSVNVSTPVEIHGAPKGGQMKCCKLTSLTIANKWHHAVKVTVSGGGTQVIAPGRQATFTGDLGECPRVSVQSAEDLGTDDAHLVAENVELCCKNLRNGSYKKFFAIDIVRYSFVELENECGGGQTPTPEEVPGVTPSPTPVTETPPPPVHSSPSPEPTGTFTPGTTVRPSPDPIGTTPRETPPPPGLSPPPPGGTTITDDGRDCACCCHLIQQWMKADPIKFKWGSPANGSARVPLGKEFPLVITAVDMDALNVSCSKVGVDCGACPPCAAGGGTAQLLGDGGVGTTSGGGSGGGGAAAGGGSSVMIATGKPPACKAPCENCSSLKLIPLAAKLHFRWEIISGPGALKTNPPYPHGHSAAVEGPAAVYVAPFTLPAGSTGNSTVTIKVTIDDSPYLADQDDDPVTETITLNLVGRKEQVAVTALSPSQGYGSLPNPDSKCDCKPVTNWITGSGITKDGDASADMSMCVDSYAVVSAPAKDTDTIDMQCAGKKCSSPVKMDNVRDALKYEWKPGGGGNAFGTLESAVFWSPSSPGSVTVQPTVTDSGIQYPDSPLTLPAINIKVGKITIDTVAPATPGTILGLGDNLALAYTIEPPGFRFEKVELLVLNKKGDVVYKKDNLPSGAGLQTAEWPGAKWNQEPHIGAYANPNNGPYEIVIVGSGPNCASASKYVDTNFTIQADIRDLKAGSAARASGLDLTIQYTRVRVIGPNTSHDFLGADITRGNIPGLGTGNYGKRLTVNKPNVLNKLEDGKWAIRVYDNFDGVGNLLDSDPGTPASDPYENDIELY